MAFCFKLPGRRRLVKYLIQKFSHILCKRYRVLEKKPVRRIGIQDQPRIGQMLVQCIRIFREHHDVI